MSTSDVIYLVRHAKAGERRTWTDDDDARPLSKHGWRQARAVSSRLAQKGASTIYSSPYVRCVQTVEPLAELIGTTITVEDRLAEERPFEPVLELLAEVDAGAVLCSHGDVIPATIDALVRRGMEVQSSVDWRKATVWVLRRKNGRVTKGKVWPPPT